MRRLLRTHEYDRSRRMSGDDEVLNCTNKTESDANNIFFDRCNAAKVDVTGNAARLAYASQVIILPC